MYVIRKALRGLELAPGEAAARAGQEEGAVTGLVDGHWNEEAARALAPVLGLDAAALAAHPRYEPPPGAHPAIRRLDMPFGEEERVNGWLVGGGGGGGKLLIDTGCDEASLAAVLADHGGPETVGMVIITHNHGDHVGGLGLFRGLDVAAYGPGGGVKWREMRPGDSLEFGGLGITAHDLAGHADPALGLEIEGLGTPVLAVGDALFAGSMGGCQGRTAYDLAHGTLRRVLEGRDDATLLLPGHGPATRLGAERVANPFCKGW